MQKRFSSNGYLREAKVNPMPPLHRVGRLSIAQRGGCIGVPRLRLHIRHCGTRVQPLRDMRPPQIMRRQVSETGSFCRL